VRKADLISQKIFTLPQMMQKVAQWRIHEKKIGFTNGVFDILHAGHIFSLSTAAKEADYLVVGLNADSSVKKLKGESRPVNNQEVRALVLASLVIIDAVVIFEEETPLELINSIMPDVLIKGGDYTVDQVAGATEVIAHGGRVVINPVLEGYSTTAIIAQQKKS
jgi:D-glycero-beta-D-manno-heptose 1-phosphate adenylyltransferase